MALIAEVLEGPQKGTSFQLLEGHTFGRVKADYLLKDDNVSSTHCRVEKDQRGYWVLVDLDSANGLLVNSQVVKKIRLIHGVTVILGNTPLRIKEVGDVTALNAVSPTTATKKWRPALSSFFVEHPPTRRPTVGSLQPFTPVVELEFIRGLQAEFKKVLAYGPRTAGFGHLDIDLEDPEAPELAFEIHATSSQGALLINKSGFKVLLNKSPVDRVQLKDGDQIHVGQSIIRVNFLR